MTWTTGFCAVMLLFLIGNFMTNLAFWLDYYGLPPVVFAVLYTLVVFDFNVSDHFCDLRVPPITAVLDSQAKPLGSNYAYVEAATTPPR